MDSGWAVVLGGAVGVIGSWGTSWLNHYFAQSQKDEGEEAAKTLLRDLLGTPEYRWRRVDTLANVVGVNELTVRRLLLECGARGSMRNGKYWGLVSRNPILSPEPGSPLEDPSFPGNPEY
jgi:hypothetical protein